MTTTKSVHRSLAILNLPKIVAAIITAAQAISVQPGGNNVTALRQ